MKVELPVLDKGFVRLVDHMGSDMLIANAARTSYASTTKSMKDCDKLLSYLMRHEHTSPFEMCEMIFVIKCPIFVARQLVRHRTASMSEVSARYTALDSDFYVPDKLRIQSKDNKQASEEADLAQADEIKDAIQKVSERTFELYELFLRMGVAREQARMILPVNIYTRFYWKMDLKNLLHFLELRLHPHAQWETRQYAEAIAKFVEDLFPITWKHFNNHVLKSVHLSGTEVEAIKFQDWDSIDVPSLVEFTAKLKELGLPPIDNQEGDSGES